MLLNTTFQHDRTVVVSKNLYASLQKKSEDFHSAMRKTPQLYRDTVIVHYHKKKPCFISTADGTIILRVYIQNAIAKKVWRNEFTHMLNLNKVMKDLNSKDNLNTF